MTPMATMNRADFHSLPRGFPISFSPRPGPSPRPHSPLSPPVQSSSTTDNDSQTAVSSTDSAVNQSTDANTGLSTSTTLPLTTPSSQTGTSSLPSADGSPTILTIISNTLEHTTVSVLPSTSALIISPSTPPTVSFSTPSYGLSTSASLTPSSTTSASSIRPATTQPTIQGSTEAKSTPAGAIAGGVIGGVVFLAVAFFLIFLFLRRRRHHRGYSITQTSHSNETRRSISAPPVMATFDPDPLSSHLALMEQVHNKAETRQRYLNNRMQQIQQALDRLQSGADTETAASGGSRISREADSLLIEQIDVLRADLERMQGHQHSEWAQGLSDQPPSGHDIPAGIAY